MAASSCVRLALFVDHIEAAWSWWGLVGLGFGAAVYGIRAAGNGVRLLPWALLGIVAGGMTAAAFVEHPDMTPPF